MFRVTKLLSVIKYEAKRLEVEDIRTKKQAKVALKNIESDLKLRHVSQQCHESLMQMTQAPQLLDVQCASMESDYGE